MTANLRPALTSPLLVTLTTGVANPLLVAPALRLAPEAVQPLVERHTEGRFFALFGEPQVNVLALNPALDGR